MRSILLVGLLSLAIGVLGALGYSHYVGEGRQLVDVQTELALAKASLVKATQESHDAKAETAALSDQIQQLNSTKADLKHQLDVLKIPAPETASAAPAFPFGGKGMADMVKAQVKQRAQQQLQLLKARLHLTPEQEAALKVALDAEAERNGEMASKMFGAGKIDLKAAAADLKNVKTVDQTLDEILTPDQKATYTQMKSDEKSSNMSTMATVELNQVAPALQLSDAQKDQVYDTLYQFHMNSTDPQWIKSNMNGVTDPTAMLDAQAKAKEDALAKILTPDQLAIYHQQAQSQLDMQKAMVQKFSPVAPAAPGAPANPAPASP